MSCIKKVLILGSGGLRIGQAGEFDYSGSQALKALKEEGIVTVLVNPNIATVQTDSSLADTVYLQPLRPSIIARIIERERPDGLLLGFGGQTALNVGLALAEQGVLDRYSVRVLGTPIDAIRITEDRDLFKKALGEIDVATPRSILAHTIEECCSAAATIGYPVMMRAGFSLGGLGSGVMYTEKELRLRAEEALTGSPQILIEEYLSGWKELEYEIVRDSADNAIVVCTMENMDPMGIHTGESIVVAPTQTLTNGEYHLLRELSLKIVRHIGIVGECNIQFALDPSSGNYRVIEMNARLSRSSALASKATGYPLAFVAAKLSLGIVLPAIRNSVTKTTSAFFEPALDYIVVKIPRWDIGKFRNASRTIGTEMKSVGEVMAIGRSFPEALQKAVRMLNIGCNGLSDYAHTFSDPHEAVRIPTDYRLFALYQLFCAGGSVEEAHQATLIDRWFLSHLHAIAKVEKEFSCYPLLEQSVRRAKQFGFSDVTLGALVGKTEREMRKLRESFDVRPSIKQIDTLAGEFPAQTNYLYCTYNARSHDISPPHDSPVIVLGSGPYAIGSSVEFDWCAVNTARTLRSLSIPTLLINSNPETVSTDYDESDRLYFEELSFERISDIIEFESPRGTIVSVGGQISNTLARPLADAGYVILGTAPHSIDSAEDREKFSSILREEGIAQPAWLRVRSLDDARAFASDVGYPIIVRPSFVLSGAAMAVVTSDEQLTERVTTALESYPGNSLVVSQFIGGAKELEIDGVAANGTILAQVISEHIENAGIHSGDATIVVPPQRLYMETIRRTKQIAARIAQRFAITGPFNIQFIARNNDIQVIECNLRASRSFPFVSKVAQVNLIEIATKAMLGISVTRDYETLELTHVGIKTPQFSYGRLKGADPVASVEMTSTGEVACIGETALEAFYLSWLATEQTIRGKRILLSIGGDFAKEKLLPYALLLEQKGWEIYATEGTHGFLTHHGIGCYFVYKFSDVYTPHVGTMVEHKKIDLIVNIPRGGHYQSGTDGFMIRRLAIDHHIPLITNLDVSRLFLEALTTFEESTLPIYSLNEYMTKGAIRM